MPSDSKPRVACACGCGRKFVPNRYNHRYATNECYQMQYHKDHPSLRRAEENRSVRAMMIPDIPKTWMPVPVAGGIFGIVPSLLRDRARKILRKKDGTEGFNTIELMNFFLTKKSHYANVINRMKKFDIVRSCSRCSRLVPMLDRIPEGNLLFCGKCPHDVPRPAPEPVPDIAQIIANSMTSAEEACEPEKEETREMPVETPEPTPVHNRNGAQYLAPLATAIDTLIERVAALEHTCGNLLKMAHEVQKAPAPDTDQLTAEVVYLKDAVRKAVSLVEDQGIRSSALETRFARLEDELGVAK